MVIKALKWIKGSRQAIKAFPNQARIIAGNQLWLVQLGRQPGDWKPMTTIGPGATEIRIHQPDEYRVIYVAKFPEAIYVLHAFEKKTQKTSQGDLKLARTAYAEIKKLRQR